ncbi:MAG: flagellar biosynthesis protein [Gammaproteobacteria bacterium]|nr:flagellar biosynthesis protein [Gammaproteobacteria bacterium]
MAFAKLVTLDRPLASAAIPGREQPVHTATEFFHATAAAYQRGLEEARGEADQQMVTFRAEMAELSEGAIKALAEVEAAMTTQVREAPPQLVLEAARRLLAGMEPSPELISRVCEEAIKALLPERSGLELVLCERDVALLEELRPAWLDGCPGVVIRADASLKPGDCLVKSRFGVTDARRQTKLEALARRLKGA